MYAKICVHDYNKEKKKEKKQLSKDEQIKSFFL